MIKKSLCGGLLLSLCLALSACQKNADTIRIATKPMTEQFILAEMLGILIQQETGADVAITKGIGGGTANIHPALLKGEFDLYPEYTGTAWLYVLKQPPLDNPAELPDALQQQYQQQYRLQWVGLYGFNNTFGLAVRRESAQEHRLNSYSDLAAASPQLVFGAEYDFFERDDGYNALTQAYGLQFKARKDLDISLKYQALTGKQIDVVSISTTDGALANPDIQVLSDDKHFYTDYHAGTVVRSDTLQKHPKLKDALLKMENLISEQDMAAMNNAVENEGQDEHTVARAFLQSKGLLRE
ncbi:glycine betaine/choline ABC-type transport system substrate-binding protein [Neisseria sp. HSC-16F19]|nr:glycine betaine ABC transporter substrate-binding protein [Neisseria sp. HSC-16F19]MCP2040784.1 glycine betaine/choline ABC-type transport system substrate-binding protein [Neisseria sp. HSC-16F19]